MAEYQLIAKSQYLIKKDGRTDSLEDLLGDRIYDCTILQYDGEHSKFFVAVESNSDATKMIKQSNKNDRLWHEKILGDIPQRMFVDVDIEDRKLLDVENMPFLDNYRLICNDRYDQVAAYIADMMIKAVYSVVPETAFDPPLNISNDITFFASNGRGDDPKLSYHIILKDYSFPTYRHLRAICNNLLDLLDPTVKEFIDKGIYKKKYGLRAPLCTKPGSARVKRLAKFSSVAISIDNCFIQHNKEDAIINFEISAPTKSIKSLATDQIVEQTIPKQFLSKLLNLIPESIISKYNSWLNICRFMKSNGFTLDEFVELSKKDPEKFDSSSCESKWIDLDISTSIGVGTMIYYAKTGSLTEVKAIMNEIKMHNRNEEISKMSQPSTVLQRGIDFNTCEVMFTQSLLEIVRIDTIYASLKQVREVFVPLITRAMAFIEVGGCQYIVTHENNIDGVRRYNITKPGKYFDNRDLPIKYWDVDAKGNPVVKSVNFRNICSVTRGLEYSGVVSIPYTLDDPSEVRSGYINLAPPLPLKEVDVAEGDDELETLIEYLKYVSGDHFEYLFDWIAHICKYPHIKTEVALYLYSEEHGTGKSMFTRLMMNLVGHYNSYKQQGTERVAGNFNKMLENKLIVTIEEASVGKELKKKTFDTFKDMITSDIIAIEGKGKDVVTVQQNINFIFISNHSYSMYIEPSDRRYFCLELPTNRIPKDENDLEDPKALYWRKLKRLINNQNALAKLYTWLRRRDIAPEPMRRPPMTNCKREAINLHRSPVDLFFEQGVFSDDFETMDQIVDRYISWYRQEVGGTMREVPNYSYFGKKMSKTFDCKKVRTGQRSLNKTTRSYLIIDETRRESYCSDQADNITEG